MTKALKAAKTPTPDVHIRCEGSIVLFWTETPAAVSWWANHVSDDAPVFAGAHCVEHRYASDIIAGLADAGFILASGR